MMYLNKFITDNHDVEGVELLASNEDDEFMLNNVLYKLIIDDLENSNPVDKDIIILYAKGYSCREIAEVYGVKTTIMKYRINKIIKRLKRKFDI